MRIGLLFSFLRFAGIAVGHSWLIWYQYCHYYIAIGVRQAVVSLSTIKMKKDMIECELNEINMAVKTKESTGKEEK